MSRVLFDTVAGLIYSTSSQPLMERGDSLPCSYHLCQSWSRWINSTPSHFTASWSSSIRPSIYIYVFQAGSFLQVFQPKTCTHFFSLLCI